MSIDRAVGVGGVSVGLIGTGIVVLWPDKRWLGWVFIAVGSGIGVLAVVWALARWHTQREFENRHSSTPPVLLPAQQLTQSPTINNSPTINVGPFTQSNQSEPRLETKEAVRPEVECTDCYFVDAALSSRNALDSDGGQPCEVAQADFYLKPIPESDPWIELRTQFVFYNQRGGRLKRVADGVWREQGHVIQMPLNIGDTKRLVIALTVGTDASFSAYEYGQQHTGRPRFLTTGEVLHHVLAPKLVPLEASDLTVQVCLIGKYMNQLRLNQEFWFGLSGSYSQIKQIPRPDWASEGRLDT